MIIIQPVDDDLRPFLSLSRKFGHFLGFNGDLSANCSLATINIPILDIIGDGPTIDYFEIFKNREVLKVCSMNEESERLRGFEKLKSYDLRGYYTS